jgi:hypothetical protein
MTTQLTPDQLKLIDNILYFFGRKARALQHPFGRKRLPGKSGCLPFGLDHCWQVANFVWHHCQVNVEIDLLSGCY